MELILLFALGPPVERLEEFGTRVFLPVVYFSRETPPLQKRGEKGRKAGKSGHLAGGPS